jgi:peptidoglycan/LPS O-acetylase OafA/YrhL
VAERGVAGTASGSARYHDLDALRAFAMLVVIAFHTGKVASGFPDGQGGLTGTALRWSTSTAHDFQMPVFFVMSGFFGALVVSRSGVMPFVRGRLKRIGIPLVVGWLVLTPVLNALYVWGEELRRNDAPPITVGTLVGDKLHHLWFLWYLLLYSALAVAVLTVMARLPRAATAARRVFATVVASRWRLVVLVALTAAMLWPAALWTAAVPPFVRPDLEPFVYFGAFFGFGWLLYGRRELLPSLRRAPVAHTLLALVASIAVIVVFDNRAADGTGFQITKLAVVLLTALVTWSAILALLGWFHRWFARANPLVRYVSDSAYWLYLGHLPLVLAMYYGMTEAGVPLAVKVVVVPVATVAILLLLYDRFVRYTTVGDVLHGHRQREEPSPSTQLAEVQ